MYVLGGWCKVKVLVHFSAITRRKTLSKTNNMVTLPYRCLLTQIWNTGGDRREIGGRPSGPGRDSHYCQPHVPTWNRRGPFSSCEWKTVPFDSSERVSHAVGMERDESDRWRCNERRRTSAPTATLIGNCLCASHLHMSVSIQESKPLGFRFEVVYRITSVFF